MNSASRFSSLRLLVLCGCLINSVSVLAQTKPSDFLDLANWKLQSIDNDNTFTTDITPSLLTTGYTSNYFYLNGNKKSVAMICLSNGKTTANTKYPRTEFRQVGSNTDWALNDTKLHTLEVSLSVEEVVPEKPQTVIGQVHGGGSNSELLKLRWTGYLPGQCYIEARFQKNDNTFAEYGVKVAEGLSLGDLISYKVTMVNGKIDVNIGTNTATQTYTSEIYGTNDAYYFKAGNYLQFESTDPAKKGTVFMYSLKLDPSVITEVESVSESNHAFPNPLNGLDLLQLERNENWKITSMEGKELLKGTGDKIDFSHLSSGIYLITIGNNSFTRIVKK
jgi:Alginate lyase/Secretion system C-terminal sorting domain